jgi:flagellin
MALGVLNNLSAIYAENNLNNTNTNLQTVLQQLSSGSRINSGADDAAGLSLVNGLAANSKALIQSVTNATEGVGLLQVADGALSQVTNLLNRAITLAAEASNGTLNSSQSSAANQEYQSILAEINNIGSTTTYNQEQVFNGQTVSIYTGDASPTGSSIDNLYIRTLSAASVGDSNGVMSYNNGQNNVFIDLSKGGKTASATDSLNATGSTTISVSYLTKGANGSVTPATANITVGSGTTYANTAQGLISAINDSGLGLTASFTTASAAGSRAANAAAAANDTNSALLTSGLDTGIQISGSNIGVDTNAGSGMYANGVGEVGTLTVSNVGDQLGGALNIVGADGQSHTLTLGAVNSTDTLANLAATINSGGYGVTASVNANAVTNASGMHAAGTVLTITSASPNVAISGTSISDTELAQSTVTLGSVAAGTGAGSTLAVMNVAGATDTLSGAIAVTPDNAAATAKDFNLSGYTLTTLAAYVNANNGGGAAFSNIQANLTNGGTTLTFVEKNATGNVAPQVTGIAGTPILDNNTTTGISIATQVATASLPAAGAAGAVGTVSVSNANDVLQAGTIYIMGADGVTKSFTLGTAGSTDNLTNLAAAINSYGATTDPASKLSVALDPSGTFLTVSVGAGGTFVPLLYGNGTSTTLSLTGAPTPHQSNATVMGSLILPSGGASADTLAGTLTIGSETITLGTAGRTNTMANLAATINNSNLGITATLNLAGTAMVFTSSAALNAGIVPNVAAASDTTHGGTLGWSTANRGQTSSQYYSLGISGTISDTSTGGGTGTMALAFDTNGAGGSATIGYSDAAGQSLSDTDLTSQINAQAALSALNAAIADVAAMDGYVGAQINTLNAVSQVLNTQQENVVSAQNAIQATDYAAATSNMSKYEILTQTGIAALAQANSVQQEVTKLLQ